MIKDDATHPSVEDDLRVAIGYQLLGILRVEDNVALQSEPPQN